MTRFKIGVAALLVGAMGALGVGCTGQPPATQAEAQQQAQWLGNGIFMIIYMAMCQANHGVCPFPLGPSDPAPVVAPTGG
jgi:hypothetical protein